MRTDLVVEMDDGGVVKVTADQRDYAALEAAPDEIHVGPLTRSRYLAWAALRRTGQYQDDFAKFNGADCVSVDAPDDGDDQDGEGEHGLDPGRKAPPAATP